MIIKKWAVEKESNNTAYLCLSLTGEGGNFNSLIKSVEELDIKWITGKMYSYYSDEGQLQWHRNRVYIDTKHQINFFMLNGNLQIVIGELTLSILGFRDKSKVKNFANLTIAITFETVSPLMCLNPWELLNFIVIKDIRK